MASTVYGIKVSWSSSCQRESAIIPVLIPPPDTPARVNGISAGLQDTLLEAVTAAIKQMGCLSIVYLDDPSLCPWVIFEAFPPHFAAKESPKEIKSHYSNNRFKCCTAILSWAPEDGLLWSLVPLLHTPCRVCVCECNKPHFLLITVSLHITVSDHKTPAQGNSPSPCSLFVF